MVKNPISRQVASISRATACLDARPPTRVAERSITGICRMFFPAVNRLLNGNGHVHYQGLPGDESRIGPSKEGNRAHYIRRHQCVTSKSLMAVTVAQAAKIARRILQYPRSPRFGRSRAA